jgi:queuosine precursor transporter
MNLLKFKYLGLLFGLYLTTMLAVFILSSRVTIVFGIYTMGASLIYPLCILIGDIIAEVYGYDTFRKITWVTALCSFIFCFYLGFVNLIPTGNEPFDLQYSAVISPIPFMTIMIIVAIITGQFIDSYFLTKWKFLIQGRYFWLRCVGSTFIGAFATSFISYLGRFFSLPFEQVVQYIAVSYALKIAGIMIFATPGVIVVYLLKRAEPQELLDVKVRNFNPFATDE